MKKASIEYYENKENNVREKFKRYNTLSKLEKRLKDKGKASTVVSEMREKVMKEIQTIRKTH